MAVASDPCLIRPAGSPDCPAALAQLRPFVEERKILSRTYDELDVLLPTSFVSVREDRVVGFAALDIYSRKLLEIRGLVVSGDCQGLGIGQRLVEACVELAREREVMEILAISSSESFFRSCGFEFTLPDEKKAFFLQIRTRC